MILERYFRTWPFSVVPDRNEPIVWAGRPELLGRTKRLLASFRFRPQSTLDLVWAAFGSGKTHLLFYLEQEARNQKDIVPWYCIIPQRARAFAEVYRSLMARFPVSSMDIAVVQAAQAAEREIAPVLQAFVMGSAEQRKMASDWLRGFKVDMRTARTLLSLPYKLVTESQMHRVLVEVLGALVSSGKRVLLLFDEYQRVHGHKARTRDILNSAVLDAFNVTPKGLSVVFSCSAAQQATAMGVLSPELVDRMRGRDILRLPTMSEEEALGFALDLFRAYRPSDYDGDAQAPFVGKALDAAIGRVAADAQLDLIPRHVIQVLDRALQSALEDGSDKVEGHHVAAAASAVASSGSGQVEQ